MYMYLITQKEGKKFIKISNEERSEILQNHKAIHLCDPRHVLKQTLLNIEHSLFFFVSPTVAKIGYYHLKNMMSLHGANKN